MFSNGTEYLAFMERNCDRCKNYIHYEDATEDNPTCHIEEVIAVCAANGEEEDFPYEWLEDNQTISRYNCRELLKIN